ncbi:acyl-CoA dehydrogenase family protein [Mumia sp. zg.B53]|uniref:acyl-CoA dehydrogenase family protein n=1 Tax=unclassified Mumia TaxID=2621872 RepID=UPI001C6E2B97|nr:MULTISPECIES: acyl-CoA dehydrogenase family protein [unclassified Mumia]MBW9207992.1 acyl-CoA dehydrogenase family protein [Mumia sp. zg.B17]MBW9214326.1 acyl-CoA dehydrogenase family protein [Mumia sp. zg.B53]
MTAPYDAWSTPERKALRESVSRFTRTEIVPDLPRWEDEGELPRELHKKAAAAGIMGIGFPEEVGGAGGDTIDISVVTEAVIESGGSSGLIAALFTHGIALPHIVSAHLANPTDRSTSLVDRYVRPTLAGEMIGALGVTEPSGGSDVANLQTRAVSTDGDAYVVNGAKTFITSGVRADFVTTAVRTGGDGFGGISLLVIDKGTPGFAVASPLRKMGWHCSDTAELAFDDVRVPAANLVGDENGGFVLVMQQFVNERLSLAVQAYTTAQRSLDLAVAYAKERETFGRPLAKRQVIRHKLVEMHRATVTARAYTRQVVEQAAAVAAGQGDGIDPMRLVADAGIAKNDAVAACDFVVDEAVQIHGGHGYMRESEVERHYRDARILGIGGGATEVMNDLIAKILGY